MRGAPALVVLCGCRAVLGIHGLGDDGRADCPPPPDDTVSPDTPPSDGVTGSDVAAACPGGFIQLAGGSAHFYKVDNGPDLYASQRVDCEASAPIAYLAIPDDQTELDGLAAMSGNDFWVGIDDIMTEGTYITAKGVPATFLPFAAGEPTGTPQQNCLLAKGGNGKLADQNCSTNFVAICECEPGG